ncbi:MAG: hypothetical protein H0V27_14230 [Pyrinomonadaceae bacterium]|nr:hypothetical protein [Pyrinomonadaceae bacterium]
MAENQATAGDENFETLCDGSRRISTTNKRARGLRSAPARRPLLRERFAADD